MHESRTVITFGTFDLFHIGHYNILRNASQLGSRLVVGISTDALNERKKGVAPFCSQGTRSAIVESLRFVDEVFFEESLEQKADYIKQHKADILVMGEDWAGKFDDLSSLCEVRYLPRTEIISSTLLRSIMQDLAVK